MSDPVTRLSTLLDRERDLLRTGALAELPAIAEEKARLAAAIPDLDKLRRPALGLLRGKARRNAQCLEAAAQGLRAAQERLREISDIRRGLGTYDRFGRRNGTPVVAGALELRA